MQIIINKIPSVHKEEDITTGLKPVDREDANVEIEKNEVVIKPDLSAIYKAHGKRHTNGGTPVYLEPGSFVFSDDKTLALNKQDHDILELKKGGKFGAKDNTPAEVLKRNVDLKHYNKMSAVIKNPYKDDIAKNTAALMLGKYQEQIGKIAMAQEDKKNFPEGLPQFAEGTAPVYDDGVKEDLDQQHQYMKRGGFLNSYQNGGQTTIKPEQVDALNKYIRNVPKEGLLPKDWDSRARIAAYLYKNNQLSPENKQYYEAYINKSSGIKTGEQSKNYTRHAYDAFQAGLQDKGLRVKWKQSTSQPASQPASQPQIKNLNVQDQPLYPKNSDPLYRGVFGKFADEKLPSGTPINPKVASTQTKQKSASQVATNSTNSIFPHTPKPKQFIFNPPANWREFQEKTYDQWRQSNNIQSTPDKTAINPNTINGSKEQPFEFDTKLNWMDRANIGNAAYNALNINRYMPMRSQIRTSPVRLDRLDPQAAINQANEAMYNAYNSNRVMNPYLASAQNASIYGRNLGALNQIRSQYDQQNLGIANQETQMNAQMAQQNAMQNAQFDQQYYRESIEGAKNFDNARAMARNNVFNVTGNAYEKALQAQAMNMQLGPESPYFFDYANMRVAPNPNRNIMNSRSTSTDPYIQQLLELVKTGNLEAKDKINALAKIAVLTKKKGGTINPWKRR